jgi:iron complex outermembrane receptor protein
MTPRWHRSITAYRKNTIHSIFDVDGNPANLINIQFGTSNPGVIGTGALTGGYTTCLGDVSGNKVSNSPEWTASLGMSYTMPVGEHGKLRLSGLANYNSGYFFEPDNFVSQDDYVLVNLSLEYRPIESIGIELWMRNVGNTEYAVQKITTGTGTTTALGAPRTYGINVKWDL